jgi:hypothetical protein
VQQSRRRCAVGAALVVAFACALSACGGSSPPAGVAQDATVATPAPTTPPRPDGWDATVCFAHKQANDSLTHFKAAGEALGAYDLDTGNNELTDAANDAKQVGDYLEGLPSWKPGTKFVAALKKAGVELRKAAGISKLVLTDNATVKEATTQTKVATTAYSASEAELAALAVLTGLECDY